MGYNDEEGDVPTPEEIVVFIVKAAVVLGMIFFFVVVCVYLSDNYTLTDHIHGVCATTQQPTELFFNHNTYYCDEFAEKNFPDEYCYAFDSCMHMNYYYPGCGRKCV